MRFVYVGAVQFSLHCLEETLAAGAEVVAVLTLAPKDAAFHSDYVDLGPLAQQNGVPVHRVRNINDPETIDLIRSFRPDAILVFGWSQLLGPELLSLAPAIGSHPARLPQGRGRHPITWALVEGRVESGLTFLWLDDGADSGDILWQRVFPIHIDDDAATLYERIEALACEAIQEFLPQLEAGSAPRIPQDESIATYWRRRTDEDRWINWHLPGKIIYDLIRGLARPYVGALTQCKGKDVLVWKARLPQESPPNIEDSRMPGTVLSTELGLRVQTGDGCLTLTEVETAGAIHVGDILGGPPCGCS